MENEYAPEFSFKEKVCRIGVALVLGMIVVVLVQQYFLPWFNSYIDRAHCNHFGNWTGLEIVIYLLCCGIPVLMLVTMLAFEVPGYIKIISSRQSPYPGEKVYRPTKYKYGYKALVRPILGITFMMALIFSVFFGQYAANDFISKIDSKRLPHCVVEIEIDK